MSEELASKKVDWFHTYLWTCDQTESVFAVDFGDGPKEDARARARASRRGHFLIKQFYPLIMEAVQVRRAACEPLALKVLEDMLRLDHMVPMRLKDANGNEHLSEVMVPDAKILGVKQKAADSILDRGFMPKGLALHGQIPGAGDGEKTSDWQAHLDELVMHLGVEVTRGTALVRARPDMQAYLEKNYPIKQVNEEPQAAMEANDAARIAEEGAGA